MTDFSGQKNIDREVSFWTKVFVGKPHECWEYKEYKDKDGYGRFWVGDTYLGAHVFAWEASRKCKVPEGKMILHLCDNRACCNPDHLYCGDVLQNAKDRKERGPKVPAHIIANPKLHKGEIWLIRKLKIVKSKRTYVRYKFPERFVAKMFKVDQSLIHLIWNSDKWLCKEGTYV